MWIRKKSSRRPNRGRSAAWNSSQSAGRRWRIRFCGLPFLLCMAGGRTVAASKREAFLNLWPPRGRPAQPERPQVRLLSLGPRKKPVNSRVCGLFPFPSIRHSIQNTSYQFVYSADKSSLFGCKKLHLVALNSPIYCTHDKYSRARKTFSCVSSARCF